MTVTNNMSPAAIAVNRFGLGARADETAQMMQRNG